ncbi:MAG: hypothetical protein FWG44_09015, partial [Oscillospiraceae bacterium]|nr:hypothetical protein [Oscillospiraceae bacterium]
MPVTVGFYYSDDLAGGVDYFPYVPDIIIEIRKVYFHPRRAFRFPVHIHHFPEDYDNFSSRPCFTLSLSSAFLASFQL